MDTVVFVNPTSDTPPAQEDLQKLSRHLKTVTRQVLDQSSRFDIRLVGFQPSIPELLEATLQEVLTKRAKAVFFAFADDPCVNGAILMIALRLLRIEEAALIEVPVYLYSGLEKAWKRLVPSNL